MKVGWNGRYADKLVEHAKQMLEFGMEHPGSYMKSQLEGLKDHGKHYPSTNYNDEMALGAVWLYFATGVRYCPVHLLLCHPCTLCFAAAAAAAKKPPLALQLKVVCTNG